MKELFQYLLQNHIEMYFTPENYVSGVKFSWYKNGIKYGCSLSFNPDNLDEYNGDFEKMLMDFLTGKCEGNK